MARDFTRREIAAAMLAPTPLLAQTDAAQQDPLAEARAQVRSAIARMEEVDLDPTVEPAFVFKP